MTVRELLTGERRSYINSSGLSVEIRRTIIKPGEPAGEIMSREDAVEKFGDHSVWLAFRDPGTLENPVDGGPVYAVCIDKNGWEEQK